MTFQLETERLVLREFAVEDALGFYQMNDNAEVLQYTGDKPFRDPEAAAAFILSYNHYKVHGYGRWTIVRKTDQAYLGFCGLKYHPETEEVDLGFRLIRNEWGRGYATEAASACLEYGLNQLKLPRIIGRVRQVNTASVKVLEKIGMKRVGAFDFEGHPAWLYESIRAD